MRQARKEDLKLVVDIITKTFESNPGVNWLLGNKGNVIRKIKKLAAFAFVKSQIRGGAYISKNNKGVALCYQFNLKKRSIIEKYYEVRFAITSIPLKRLPQVLKREAFRNSIRPASGAYLYFWFLGVDKGGREAVYELRDGVFNEAKKKKLPIYLETSVDRNKKAYERFGFETYYFWEDVEANIKFWFMKWEPSNIEEGQLQD